MVLKKKPQKTEKRWVRAESGLPWTAPFTTSTSDLGSLCQCLGHYAGVWGRQGWRWGDGVGAEHLLEKLDRTCGGPSRCTKGGEETPGKWWIPPSSRKERGRAQSTSPEALQTQRESGDPEGKPPATLASTSSGTACKHQEGCASVSRNMCHLPNFIMQPTKNRPMTQPGDVTRHPPLCCAWISLHSWNLRVPSFVDTEGLPISDTPLGRHTRSSWVLAQLLCFRKAFLTLRVGVAGRQRALHLFAALLITILKWMVNVCACQKTRTSLLCLIRLWTGRARYTAAGTHVPVEWMDLPWASPALCKTSYDQPRQHIKKQRHYFANKGLSSQSYGFSSGHVWMWELDNKESRAPKNWCFWTVVLEKTLESPLDCKQIQLVHPKGNQSWIFIGRTDAEAEAPILWLPDEKSRLTGKDPDAGRDWEQEEKRTTENEMAGWHHRLDGREFE